MKSKQEIVVEFLEKGHLLAEDALEELAKKPKLKPTRDRLVLRLKDFGAHKEPVKPAAAAPKESIRILKNISEKPAEVTTEDVIGFYNSKYTKMRDIITGRIKKDFVSLNKLDASRKETHVIGIVRDITKKDGKYVLSLEDPTATVPVIFKEKPNAELDDVIAVRCTRGGKVLFGKDVLYPDIPLREPTKGHGRACFVSDLHLEEAPPKDMEKFAEWFSTQPIKYMFVAGDVGDLEKFEEIADKHWKEKKIFLVPGEADTGDKYPQLPLKTGNSSVIPLSNPSLVRINGVNVLITHKGDVSILKKRYVGKPDSVLKKDELVLEDVPDILHVGHDHEAFVKNYKSVTIVNAGSLLTDFRPVVVDLGTRETSTPFEGT